jgi:hypothetical protein
MSCTQYLEDGGSRFLQNIFQTIQHYIPETHCLVLLVFTNKVPRKKHGSKKGGVLGIK